jgi:tellurite resistance protein TehA-like permease
MFEAPLLVKPLLWVLAAQALLYLLALRPWRLRELPRAFSPSIDLFFVVLVVLGVLALVEPRPFDLASERVIAQTSLPESLATIDFEIAELQTVPDRIWLEIKASFGFAPPPPVPDPTLVLRPGAVEAAVVEAVAEIVSMLMRVYVYLAVILGLWMTIVMRLFVRSSTARRLRDERAWQTVLEAEWRARSETVFTPAERPGGPAAGDR